eukprot:CAMPEP_0177492504 /NCGR_PEP_ID=MMETSP0369-20130122/32392_1 /TAXON_ID=447022 ORGANISM="Scrippsiella hangoei-like, Strain SHHI-4" /NCGR_SAMPLE_ID=MMETSP0369 /ASSEMBLY_ACC=CAM_ASM_000364 /LENGTH=45 /DNA_ID= /DNA_START= /DNA_END= /DNA_ORIENTATION=
MSDVRLNHVSGILHENSRARKGTCDTKGCQENASSGKTVAHATMR